VAVKQGINRESAMLYPMGETRPALYEGARRSMAAIGRCRPYDVKFPIQARKEWLSPDPAGGQPKPRTKEGTIAEPLKLLDF
jgi:hypothetical protein